ncbi:HpcH/HpaI aldolase/citrate lyase family protein [Leifsonia poae]|uniref:Citrate lyase subunit beta-like protein n=1 Tax=Leifsonia poae TaxID=110933 RepID=A0A9W6H8F2_9MICO|nr:CoA ester lyase [Leifsonia poae]GLJ75799.1 citrate lyase subunit beta-like protein [Leifsonia poae]
MTGFPFGPALLFCPADRPDRYARAVSSADAVILDLEDAVDPARRVLAREALVAADAEGRLDPERVIVRVNPAGTDDHGADLAALAVTDLTTVMLPKAESVDDLRDLTGLDVIALCETARGVMGAPQLAGAAGVVALMWGAEDLVASMGGTSSRHDDGRYRDVAVHARSSVLLAASAAGIGAVDTVHLDIADLAGLGAEAVDAAAVGFAATACIHPSQVETIRAAYRPSGDEIANARALLDAAAGAGGVFAFEGRMVDGPVLAHARIVLRRAGLDG